MVNCKANFSGNKIEMNQKGFKAFQQWFDKNGKTPIETLKEVFGPDEFLEFKSNLNQFNCSSIAIFLQRDCGDNDLGINIKSFNGLPSDFTFSISSFDSPNNIFAMHLLIEQLYACNIDFSTLHKMAKVELLESEYINSFNNCDNINFEISDINDIYKYYEMLYLSIEQQLLNYSEYDIRLVSSNF